MDGRPVLDAERGDWRAVLHAAKRISHKWHPVLVHHLLAGPLGFTELESRTEGLSAKVLTDGLRSLEADGIVSREVLSESPLRVQYRLTPAGRDLEGVVAAMEAWGRRHRHDPGR